MSQSNSLPILLVVAILLGGLPAARHYLSGLESVSEHAQKIESPVIMFSTRWCPYCHRAREYFKRHSITYTEYDIEVSMENSAKFRALGGTGVPLILVGNKRMDGFTPRSFNDLLSRQ